MKKEFGKLADGSIAYLYTLRFGGLEAQITDFGATLYRLYAPDAEGELADVVLGFDSPEAYAKSGAFFGTVVGRNSNRIKGGKFRLNGKEYQMASITVLIISTPAPIIIRIGCGMWKPSAKTPLPLAYLAPTATRASPATQTSVLPMHWKRAAC